jgi:hypothetical protein
MSTGLWRIWKAVVITAIVLAAPVESVSGQTVVYLNDTFSDQDRSTQSLPDSAQWFVGAHHSTASSAYGTLDTTNGNLVLDRTTGSAISYAAAWAHFAPSGSPVTIPVGQTMTLSFDVTFTGGAFSSVDRVGEFRFALFNSNGSRVAADFAGANESGISSGTTFSGWRGYEGQAPVDDNLTGTGTADFLVRKRTGTGNGLFTSSNWSPTNTSSSTAVTEPLFAADQTYTGSLTLWRMDDSTVAVQASLGGVTTGVRLDNTTPVFQLDTVAFFALDQWTHDLVFDNVQVSIPEPSTAAMGFIALPFLLRRRRV